MTIDSTIEFDGDTQEVSPVAREQMFRASELRRVGIAATMIAICSSAIIFATIASIGHYNPLVHCGPVAAIQGATIALLIGRFGRWRCLALLGVVYGLVLLMQVGLFYLLPVTTTAGAMAALAGRAIESAGASRRTRTVAACVAGVTYVFIAGFGTPIRIYFATGGSHEPFVWALWFAEWPLRITGATIGALLARRWLLRRSDIATTPIPQTSIDTTNSQLNRSVIRRARSLDRNIIGAAVRIAACVFACILPLSIEDVRILAAIAIVYALYAWWAGLRKQIFHIALGLVWGWLLFGGLSYAWHRDVDRVIDLGRTFVLRFTPMMLASVALVATARAVDLLRLLRVLRLSRAVLIPLSTVIRAIPRIRRTMKQGLADLKRRGEWHGPLSMFRRPRAVVRALLIPHVEQWATELARESDRP